MNLWSRLGLSAAVLAVLCSCGTSRPDAAPLPTVGFVSQETLAHALRQRTLHRSGTSGFEVLPDGKESHMARLAMVEAAQKTLDVQYFIWSDDVIGAVYADRLLAAADRGVRVRLLLDMTRGAQEEVRSAALAAHPNIQVGFFNPTGDLKGIFAGNPIPVIGELDRIQSRMHNKMMVADGSIAIGGGRNLGDPYFGIDRKRNLRDLDFIAIGPVVQDAARAFDLYWKSPLTRVEDQAKVSDRERDDLQELRDRIKRKKRLLSAKAGNPYPVSLSRGESLKVLQQMTGRMIWADYEFVADPPERMLKVVPTASPVGRTVEKAIGEAKRDVVIHAAYFIPQQGMLDLLRATVARGVRVRVLTNSLASIESNPAMGGIANRRDDALKTGIELYELNALAPSRRDFIHVRRLTPMGMHTKGVVVDDKLVFVGSYNMDPRSKFINTETGVIIEDTVLGARLKSYLEVDLQPTHSWRVKRDDDGVTRWYGQGRGGRAEVHRIPPGVAFSRRVQCFILQCLPLEDLL